MHSGHFSGHRYVQLAASTELDQEPPLVVVAVVVSLGILRPNDLRVYIMDRIYNVLPGYSATCPRQIKMRFPTVVVSCGSGDRIIAYPGCRPDRTGLNFTVTGVVIFPGRGIDVG